MNVIVSVECFETLMKRKSKHPFQWKDPVYQRTGSNLAVVGAVSLFYLQSCRAGTLDFLGSNRKPHEITFRFLSHPSVDLFKRLLQRTDFGTASLWANLTIFIPFAASQDKTAAFFPKQCKHHFHIAVGFYGWISTRIVPQNSDRNIKCPDVSARACHPSCCTLHSSDERQPPNMWQGHRPCGKWFGKCSIYSVSQC